MTATEGGSGPDSNPPLRRTPLHEFHLRHGAKMVPFAGHEMPLQYPAGIIEEHRAVRARAGLFDVSHMLQVRLDGSDSTRLLEKALPMTVRDLPTGRCRYSMLLNEDAGIVDDLIATRPGENSILLVANASRRQAVLSHLAALCRDMDCAIAEEDAAMLALQGPEAAGMIASLHPDAAGMEYLDSRACEGGVRIARTGYTGELGFEISGPAAGAARLAEALVSAGAVPAGLGARDCLRMEAGFRLYGSELDESVSPREAGLGWVVSRRALEERRFVGAAALESRPVTKRLVGLRPQGRAPVRAGTVLRHGGEERGVVTSGGYGPTLEAPIALGYVPPDRAEPGTMFDASVRNRYIACRVVPLPFVPHRFRARG